MPYISYTIISFHSLLYVEHTMSTVSPPVALTRSYDLIFRIAESSPLPVYTTSSLRV